jgi:hypothetical protein
VRVYALAGKRLQQPSQPSCSCATPVKAAESASVVAVAGSAAAGGPTRFSRQPHALTSVVVATTHSSNGGAPADVRSTTATTTTGPPTTNTHWRLRLWGWALRSTWRAAHGALTGGLSFVAAPLRRQQRGPP